jgi:hypothetical protein
MEPISQAACTADVRDTCLRALALVTLIVASACTEAPQSSARSEAPSRAPVAVRLAVAPPLLAPDGHLRFVTTVTNDVRAEEVATGTVLWTLPVRIPAAAPTARWRLLISDDGTSVYAQSLSDEQGLTYEGTQRIEARTGVELANDIKFEVYWYQNIVFWTALMTDGKLQMAIRRPVTAGGGYWLRTFDPLTLKMLTDVPHAGPPPIGSR